MVKRVFLVHRWDGSPDADWYGAIKERLEAHGCAVSIVVLPDPSHPKIKSWVAAVRKAVGKVDASTFFIGHSIGVQTILRFLEGIKGLERAGGMISVGGWVSLTPASVADVNAAIVAQPWLDTPIDWKRVKRHVDKVVCFFSSNDPFVPLADAKVFAKELQAEIVIEEKMGHYTGDDGITDLPQVFKEMMVMISQ